MAIDRTILRAEGNGQRQFKADVRIGNEEKSVDNRVSIEEQNVRDAERIRTDTTHL